MAQTREQLREASAKKKRGKKRVQLGGLTGGVRGASPGKTSKASAKASLNRVEKQFVIEMLTGYSAVAKKAKEAGRPVYFTVEVLPDGTANPVAPPVAAPFAPGDELDSALAAARERGRVKVAEILKGEDMMTAADFGSLIGASHETVNVKRGRGEVLGLQGATRAVRYPRWQVTDTGLPLPGLSRLFEALGKQPWTVYRFLKTAHPELGGRTALEALKAGLQDAVLRVAQNQTHGAFS